MNQFPPSRLLRRARRVATAAAAALCIAAAPTAAHAAPIQIPAGSSGSTGSSDISTEVWNFRTGVHQQSAGLPAPLGDGVRNLTDGMVNTFFPGLIAEQQAAEAARLAPPPAPAPAPAPVEPETPAFDYGSCPPTARACVDLTKQRTWLQRDGHVTYGAVPISSGAVGFETPKGMHYVNRKIKDEISREFNNAPMPYAVYFTNNGIAFHQGSVDLWSHGCIHLNTPDAVHYFDTLRVGDQVYVY